MEPQLAQSKNLQQATTLSSKRASTVDQSTANAQHDRTREREKAFNMQRIQLAGQLSSERKQCKDLEARVYALQDELASLRFRSEAFEAECARLHGEIGEAAQQLGAQTVKAAEQNKAMLDRVTDLESKLDEAAKSLEESILGREILQKAHDEAVKNCDQQADKVQQLEKELEISRTQIHDLNANYDRLQEQHDDDAKDQLEQLEVIRQLKLEAKDNEEVMQDVLAELGDARVRISMMEETHEVHDRDLQQRVALKDTEVKDLKREVDTLRDACADAISKKEAAEMDFQEYSAQTLQEQQELTEARNQSLEESQELRRSLDEFQRSTKPFTQTVIICVDVSGSLTGVIHDIKQVYRDVVHTIKSNNSDARVAVVIHGSPSNPVPSPLQPISDKTFQIMETNYVAGTEDYTYCLEQANGFLKKNAATKRLVILIGDGDAICSNRTALFTTCEQLRSAHIFAHSIVIPSSSWSYAGSSPTMRDISAATGGRVENKSTYLSALDELLRHEREEYFKATRM